jgi:hypothetical protein
VGVGAARLDRRRVVRALALSVVVGYRVLPWNSLLPPLSHLQSFCVPPLHVARSVQLHGQLLLLDTSPPCSVFGPRLAVPLDHLALASLLLYRCRR